MSADQLIAKALSTTSEQEAIACLLMARKKSMVMKNKISSETTEDRQKLIDLVDKYNDLVNNYIDLLATKNDYRQKFADADAKFIKSKKQSEFYLSLVYFLGFTIVTLAALLTGIASQ
jgi:hypothetical protein